MTNQNCLCEQRQAWTLGQEDDVDESEPSGNEGKLLGENGGYATRAALFEYSSSSCAMSELEPWVGCQLEFRILNRSRFGKQAQASASDCESKRQYVESPIGTV